MKVTNQLVTGLLEGPQPTLAGSIYMPTQPQSSSQNISADRTRFKNALQYIAAHDSYDKTVLGETMKKLEDLYEDLDFWKHQDRSLAVLFSADMLEYFKLPLEVTEATYLKDSFVLSPLFFMNAAYTDYYVLDVNLTAPRLLHSTGGVLEVVNQDGMPDSLEDEVGKDEYQKHLQHRHGGPLAFHGHGEDDAVDDETRRYLKLIVAAVDTFLVDETAPLLLAGTPNRTTALRKDLQYGQVVEASSDGSAERLSVHELYEATRPLIQDHVTGKIAAAVERLSQSAPQFVAVGKKEIIDVATTDSGRIENLYLPTYRLTNDSIQAGQGASLIIEIPTDIEEVEPLVTAVVKQGGSIVPVQIDAYDFLDQPKALCRF